MEKESGFRMPTYMEIPDVGLYLEQMTKFVSECLSPLECVSITGSMISNYVKKGLVRNPVKKQYYRDQIADVLFIAVTKTVLSLEQVQLLLQKQRESESKEAYECFCRLLEHALSGEQGSPEEKEELLQMVLTAFAQKLALDRAFAQQKG